MERVESAQDKSATTEERAEASTPPPPPPPDLVPAGQPIEKGVSLSQSLLWKAQVAFYQVKSLRRRDSEALVFRD
eukprot:scaffold8262_cov267-Pinguiococcus_pyrenoidosus.AAC.1